VYADMRGGSIGGGGVKYNKWKWLAVLQLSTHYYLRNVPNRNFKFCMHIHNIDRNKTPGIKMSGKVAVGVLRDSRKFSGHPYIGHIRRSSLW